MKSIQLFILIGGLLFAFSCGEDELPEVQTKAPTIANKSEENVITYTSIEIAGNVTDDGGTSILARGVCWNTTGNPILENDSSTKGNSDNFTSTFMDLTANTTYYFKTYATNSIGTTYGEEQAINTSAMEGSTWDFTIVYQVGTTTNADVTFNADGTTVYDVPADPGTFRTEGLWSIDENTVSYKFDATSPGANLDFTGLLSENKMTGTFLYFGETKDFSAEVY